MPIDEARLFAEWQERGTDEQYPATYSHAHSRDRVEWVPSAGMWASRVQRRSSGCLPTDLCAYVEIDRAAVIADAQAGDRCQ